MTAIDISRYQGVVDFAAVKSSGVSLVIAKMGGGDAGVYVDAKWVANRDGIRAAGLTLGSYFFNGPGDTPTQAADFQFQNADWRPGDLIIIDVEGGAIAWSPSQVLEWVNRILAHGVPAAQIGVYMSASVVTAYNWGPVAALGTFLWIASYGANTGTPGTPPRVIHWPAWSLWQYTSNGTIPGVPGRVDVSQVASSWASTGTITSLSPQTPLETDMPRNLNNNGTIITSGGTWAKVWTDPNDFLYQSCMAWYGAPIPVSLTPDQLTTMVNFENAIGAAYGATSPAGAQAAITPADIAAIDASLQAEFAATIAAIHGVTAPDLSGLAAQIAAVSAQGHADAQTIEAILAKGFTITGTVK